MPQQQAMEKLSYDLVVVGGGAAGLRAAIAAAEKFPKLKIALISKVYPVRSHTVSAEGGLAGAMREYDSFEKHAYDTVKGGDFLADQDAVEFFVKECPKEILNLEEWGCPWSREADGEIAVRAFGGMSVKRTVYAADKTGFYMLHSLFERSLKYDNIVRHDEWFVTKIFADDGRVGGVFAMALKTGERFFVGARAVIIATGGCGRIFRFTTNGYIKTGDGIALAYEAGAKLKDMEFVQFHPTGLPRTGILITEAARGEGGYLLNRLGERFLKNYLPGKMELGPRDMISRAIMREIAEGRGFDGPHGGFVHLDIRHLGEKVIDTKLPLVREMAQEYQNVDPVKEPIPVRPVMHYFMGGIHTNVFGETSLEGLFAAGEAACVTINGANRLGSNSLSECLVFGKAAGERAAEFCASQEAANFSAALVENEETRLDQLLKNDGRERVSGLREAMEEAMESSAGILRNEKNIQSGIEKIRSLQERLPHVQLQDKSAIFNTEFTALLELHSMLTLAKLILESASRRKESRGSHFRTDFPTRDDGKFLHHQTVQKTPRGVEYSTLPVILTKWQPEERKY